MDSSFRWNDRLFGNYDTGWKAGIHEFCLDVNDFWIPAFAGITGILETKP